MGTYSIVTVDNASLLWVTSLTEPNKYEGKSHLWWKCAGHTTSHCPGGIEVMSQGSGGVRLVHAGVGEGWKECGGPGEPIFAQGFTHTDSIVNPTPRNNCQGWHVYKQSFSLSCYLVSHICGKTTLRGIVVLKSYNCKCNPDKSNALCTIIVYTTYMVINITIILLILFLIATQSGVLNNKQLFLILLHHPPPLSIILLLILLLIVMQSGVYNTHSVYIKQLLRQVVTSGPATRLPPRLLTLTNVVQVVIIISIVFVISFSFLSTE